MEWVNSKKKLNQQRKIVANLLSSAPLNNPFTVSMKATAIGIARSFVGIDVTVAVADAEVCVGAVSRRGTTGGELASSFN